MYLFSPASAEDGCVCRLCSRRCCLITLPDYSSSEWRENKNGAIKWKLWYFHELETAAFPEINICPRKHQFSSSYTLKTNDAARVMMKVMSAIFKSLWRDFNASSHYLLWSVDPNSGLCVLSRRPCFCVSYYSHVSHLRLIVSWCI